MLRFVSAVLLLIAPLAASQTPSGNFKGTVLDRETREGLPSVTVVVMGTQTGVSTDEKGRFSLPELPAGTYSLQFRLVGYDPLVVDIDFKDGTPNDLSGKLHRAL